MDHVITSFKKIFIKTEAKQLPSCCCEVNTPYSQTFYALPWI